MNVYEKSILESQGDWTADPSTGKVLTGKNFPEELKSGQRFKARIEPAPTNPALKFLDQLNTFLDQKLGLRFWMNSV